MPGLDLTVLILTYNEEKHLARCIGSVKTLANRVVVIDSASTDRTVDLAKALGADVYQNRWVNHAAQFNWALDNTSISTKWIVRLDADEIVSSELADMLLERLPSIAESTAGLTVNRRIYFLNKWIRHGGLYPARMLRIFRRGKGRCEQRWMDEHILVSGTVQNLEADICDMNLNSVSWWISKHNCAQGEDDHQNQRNRTRRARHFHSPSGGVSPIAWLGTRTLPIWHPRRNER